jgi:hypothetical protein
VSDDDPPYWVLISVLFSTQPLTPKLAMQLHRAAYSLYAADEELGKLDGDLLQGEVRNLRRVMAMGSISGPGFEADFDTERGHGQVRFLLTQPGIEHMAQSRPSSSLN